MGGMVFLAETLYESLNENDEGVWTATGGNAGDVDFSGCDGQHFFSFSLNRLPGVP